MTATATAQRPVASTSRSSSTERTCCPVGSSMGGHAGRRRGHEIRGARVTLVGVETWRYDRTYTDSKGHSHTETHTATRICPTSRSPSSSPTSFGPGETRGRAVPDPRSLARSADVRRQGTARRLGAAGQRRRPGLRSRGRAPGRPPPADRAAAGGRHRRRPVRAVPGSGASRPTGLSGSITLDPVPLCVGAAFHGTLTVAAGSARNVQEVRLEIRVVSRSTVEGGRKETITAWPGDSLGEGSFGGGATTIDFDGELPRRWLPTIETPHGRATARSTVIVATAWARDPHLVPRRGDRVDDRGVAGRISRGFRSPATRRPATDRRDARTGRCAKAAARSRPSPSPPGSAGRRCHRRAGRRIDLGSHLV